MSSIYDALRRIQGQKDPWLLLPGDRGTSSRKKTLRIIAAAVVVCVLCSAGVVTAVRIAGRDGGAAPGKTASAGEQAGEASVRTPAGQPGGGKSGAAAALPGAVEDFPGEDDPLEDVDDYLRRGERHYQEQEYDKALVTYTQALRFFRRDARLLNNIGIVMLAKGQPEKAVNYFRQSKSLSAASVEPVYNLACAYARLGDSSQAVAHLKTACAMSPHAREWAARDPDLLVLRGVREFDEIVAAQ